MSIIHITRKSAFWTNVVYTCISTVVQFFYLFLMLAAPWNIVAPCLTTLGTIVISTVNLFNTTIAKKKNDNSTYNYHEQLRKVKIFLGLIIPCMLLNAGAAFIGGYQGILLLMAALAFSSTLVTLGIAIAVGVIALTSTTLYNIIQSYGICKRLLSKPKLEKTTSNPESTAATTTPSPSASSPTVLVATLVETRKTLNHPESTLATRTLSPSASSPVEEVSCSRQPAL